MPPSVSWHTVGRPAGPRNPPPITLSTQNPHPARFPGVQGPLYSLHPVSHTHNRHFSPRLIKSRSNPLSLQPISQTLSLYLTSPQLFLSHSLSFCLFHALFLWVIRASFFFPVIRFQVCPAVFPTRIDSGLLHHVLTICLHLYLL